MFKLDPTGRKNLPAVAAGAEVPPGEEISTLVQETLVSQPEMGPRPLKSITVTPSTPEEFGDILFRGDLDQIVHLKEAGYVSELWDLWSPEDGVEALQFIHALTVNDIATLWQQVSMIKTLPKHPRILAMLLGLPPSRNSQNESARLALIESQLEAGVRLREGDKADALLVKNFCAHAIDHNNLRLTQLYLKAGIDTNATHQNVSPAGWALSREMIQLLDTEDYLYSKLLSHFYNLEGVFAGVNLEGSQSWYMNPFVSECLEAFKVSPQFSSTQIGGQFAGLIEAFKQTYNSDRTAEDICAKVQRGELCFVDAGWANHLISVTFSGDYMAICNRGQGSASGTLRVYKIDRAIMTPELVTKILKNGQSHELRAHFYYNELPAWLGGEEDELTAAFKAIAPKFQKVGNCVLASEKAAIRFAWVMQLMAGGMPLAEAMRVGRLESKAFTDFAANYVLEEHRDKLLPGLARARGFKRAVADKQFCIWVRENPYLNMLHRGALLFVRRRLGGAHG